MLKLVLEKGEEPEIKFPMVDSYLTENKIL